MWSVVFKDAQSAVFPKHSLPWTQSYNFQLWWGDMKKNHVPNCASWSAPRRWRMWIRQKQNRYDRWLAPPGSVFKKLKVFLWDCLRFQEAWALFLSAIVVAEVRCHLLCDKLPFLKWKPVETAPRPNQHGPVSSWIPLSTHLCFLLVLLPRELMP